MFLASFFKSLSGFLIFSSHLSPFSRIGSHCRRDGDVRLALQGGVPGGVLGEEQEANGDGEAGLIESCDVHVVRTCADVVEGLAGVELDVPVKVAPINSSVSFGIETYSPGSVLRAKYQSQSNNKKLSSKKK